VRLNQKTMFDKYSVFGKWSNFAINISKDEKNLNLAPAFSNKGGSLYFIAKEFLDQIQIQEIDGKRSLEEHNLKKN
jgi:hypothetical protein